MATRKPDAIRTVGLTKKFGAFVAVNDLDLQVQAGEIFGFLGPNGAGKSTTIRMLLDQLRASSGSATVLGHDIHDESLEIRRRIGYIPGDLSLYPKLTGRQTIDFFAGIRGGVDMTFVEELTERLDADLSRRVSEYSTGNRQKIGLIQAFMHKPDLLILDEPNAGLDPLIQQTFHAMAHDVVNLHSRDADLEEIFLAYYRDSDADARLNPSRPPVVHDPSEPEARRGR